MNIEDWFDVGKYEHIKAFQQMQNTGFWPKGFVPEHVTFDRPTWYVAIIGTMANAYMNTILNAMETGMKKHD